MLDMDEYERWMRQAKHTISSAKGDLTRGDYDWASFKAHQAAEYAIKAFIKSLGKPAFGHSVSRLLTESDAPADLVAEGKKLDRHYLAPRYPNQWVEGVPTDYYTEEIAEEAINIAEKMMEWVEGCFQQLRRGRNY